MYGVLTESSFDPFENPTTQPPKYSLMGAALLSATSLSEADTTPGTM